MAKTNVKKEASLWKLIGRSRGGFAERRPSLGPLNGQWTRAIFGEGRLVQRHVSGKGAAFRRGKTNTLSRVLHARTNTYVSLVGLLAVALRGQVRSPGRPVELVFVPPAPSENLCAIFLANLANWQ